MGGGTTSKTNENTASTTNTKQNVNTGPYLPTQAPLNNIISAAGSIPGATDITPTAAQNAAIQGINSITNLGANTYNPQTEGVISNLYNGGGVSAGLGPVQSSYNAASGALSPYLSSGYLNPMSNPTLGPALSALNQQITNGATDQFSGAGQNLFDPSGQFGKALGTGLGQGEAGLLLNQYNSNVGAQQNAANTLGNLGNQAGQSIAGITQQGVMNQEQAPNMIGALTNPYQTALQTAQVQAGLPYTNLNPAAQFLTPLAQLGQTGTSTGTANQTGTMSGTTTTTSNPVQTAIGAGIGGLGLLSLGGSNSIGTQLGGWLSDRRAKRDIKRIGTLDNGLPVYKFRYLGSDLVNIGLMADDVEKVVPEAVSMGADGFKRVDYGRAA